MLKNPRLLGLLIILLAVIFFRLKTPQSQVNLISDQNKFKLNFTIQKNDQAAFNQLLEKLNLPQSLKQGVEFQLDSTSSAKLAYSVPISATLVFEEEKLKFSGKTTAPFFSDRLDPSLIKIPQTTTIAIFAEDLTSLLKKRFLLPPGFDNWLVENLKGKDGQYFLIFGQSDFAIVFKPQKPPDFPKLSESSEYKQETENNLNFHLLKLPQDKEQETTLTFFEIGRWLFMASSFEAAKELVAIQKGEVSSIDFLDSLEKPVSMALLIRNTNLDSQALTFFIKDDQKVKTQFEKIKEAQLIINDKELSGFIDLSKQ